MIPFNGTLAKAFPERTARIIAERARQEDGRKLLNPFGALESDIEKNKTPVSIGRLCIHRPTGQIGRPTRWVAPTGSTFESPTHAYFVPIDSDDGTGFSVLLTDLIPQDDEESMSLEGRMRVSTESRPHPSTDARGQRETESAREHARESGNAKAAAFRYLTKIVQHVFSENDRVVVHSPGHYHHGSAGKIIDDRSDSRLRVKLDSGHEIQAAESELVPESLAPVAESAKILKRAIGSGVVSAHDQATIQTAFEKISTGRYATDPFGQPLSDSPFHTLKIFAEKYASADDGNALAKRASGFQVGDRVKDKMGCLGKITKITATHADIDYENGTTGTCIIGYIESAA